MKQKFADFSRIRISLFSLRILDLNIPSFFLFVFWTQKFPFFSSLQHLFFFSHSGIKNYFSSYSRDSKFHLFSTLVWCLQDTDVIIITHFKRKIVFFIIKGVNCDSLFNFNPEISIYATSAA